MASSNTIKNYDRIIEWYLNNSTATTGSTGSLYWFASNATQTVNHHRQPADTDTFWLVKTITYIPSSGAATGTHVFLLDRDADGPRIFTATLQAAEDVVSQTYDPPLRCRPCHFSSLSDAYTTGSYYVFHLA